MTGEQQTAMAVLLAQEEERAAFERVCRLLIHHSGELRRVATADEKRVLQGVLKTEGKSGIEGVSLYTSRGLGKAALSVEEVRVLIYGLLQKLSDGDGVNGGTCRPS